MGIKLKSLLPAVGTYGTVAADGIVDVDAAKAEALIKTGRFVRATAADVKSAQKRQEEMLAAVPGATVWTQVAAAEAGSEDNAQTETEGDDKPPGDSVVPDSVSPVDAGAQDLPPADETDSAAKQKRLTEEAKAEAGGAQPAAKGPAPKADKGA